MIDVVLATFDCFAKFEHLLALHVFRIIFINELDGRSYAQDILNLILGSHISFEFSTEFCEILNGRVYESLHLFPKLRHLGVQPRSLQHIVKLGCIA